MSDEFDPMPSSRRPKQSPTTIGNHKLKPATLMMGYGFDPALSEGSLKAPIRRVTAPVYRAWFRAEVGDVVRLSRLRALRIDPTLALRSE